MQLNKQLYRLARDMKREAEALLKIGEDEGALIAFKRAIIMYEFFPDSKRMRRILISMYKIVNYIKTS
jgi:hypothetical protein